jgi:hypothetical protein
MCSCNFIKNLYKIPYIKVESAEEYFNLPLDQTTTKLGLYRVPYGLPVEDIDDLFSDNPESKKGWGYWNRQIKKRHPIQWFFRDWLFSTKNPIFYSYKRFIEWPLTEAHWATKNFIKPAFPRWRKTLPRHKWSDITRVVVESNFNLILDFYYEEVLDGWVDWDSDEIHKTFKNKLEENVKWIEEGRARWQNEIDEELTRASKNKSVKDYNKRYGEYNKLEKTMHDKETEILKWFIDNRSFFWT